MSKWSSQFLWWILSNLAWDSLKNLVIYLVQAGLATYGGKFLVDTFANFFQQSTNTYLILVFAASFFLFGLFSLLRNPLINLIAYLLRRDRPYINRDNEWNAIVKYQGEKVAIGMISFRNQPAVTTDRSIAFDTKAELRFVDRKGNDILRIECGKWTRESAEALIAGYGKSKDCQGIDFYTYDTWYLPIVYKIIGDSQVYAFDPREQMKQKPLGHLPIMVEVTFESENLKRTSPIRYLLTPQPAAMHDGFWIQKR